MKYRIFANDHNEHLYAIFLFDHGIDAYVLEDGDCFAKINNEDDLKFSIVMLEKLHTKVEIKRDVIYVEKLDNSSYLDLFNSIS